MTISYILVTLQILTSGTTATHVEPFETQKECMAAGEVWLEEQQASAEGKDTSGSIWFYCQPARGGAL